MACPPGWKPKPQRVICTTKNCGAVMMRATHLKEAKCSACQTKARQIRQQSRWKRLHQQSRRYRIIMHRCGYDCTDQGFKDFLEDLRDHPLEYRRRAEGRNACIDVAFERKAKKFGVEQFSGQSRHHVS